MYSGKTGVMEKIMETFGIFGIIYWGRIGIMEKITETKGIIGIILGLYKDNGNENY